MGGNDSWIAYARAVYRKRYGAGKKINGQVCFGKVVIYTVITGNYDSLSTPSFRSEGVDYLCFTNNRELQSDFWEIRHIEDGILNDVGLSRKPKILAHICGCKIPYTGRFIGICPHLLGAIGYAFLPTL